MTLITMAISPYILKILPKAVLETSFVKRSIVLFVLNAILLGLMGFIDLLLDKYPEKGGYALGVMFVLRALQGFSTGILFLMMQVLTLSMILRFLLFK